MKAILLAALLPLGATVATTASAKDDPAAGATLYATHCVACHGADRAGVPGTFPALTGVGKRLQPPQIKDKIKQGGGLMPPFSQLTEQEVNDLAAFLAQ
ncbi:MAG TPA: cytochrome c [Stenotrophomonas sp.]